MNIPRLFDFKAKTLARADQIDEEFENVIAAVEGIAAASTASDAYQAGVLASTDWNPVVVTFAGGTGHLDIKTALGGAAWLPAPGGGLVRTFTAPQEWLGIIPSSLPAPSGYRGLGFELTASGATALLSVVVGPEDTTSAKALAALPAPTAGKVRINDQTIFNKAGTYEWGSGLRDRRRWARGGSSLVKRTSGNITLGAGAAALDATGLALRMECSGVPLRLSLFGGITTFNGKVAEVGFRQDGAAVDGTADSAISLLGENESSALVMFLPLQVSYVFTPAAGSHLFQPTGKCTEAGQAVVASSAGRPLIFKVDELRASANNGTS